MEIGRVGPLHSGRQLREAKGRERGTLVARTEDKKGLDGLTRIVNHFKERQRHKRKRKKDLEYCVLPLNPGNAQSGGVDGKSLKYLDILRVSQL